MRRHCVCIKEIYGQQYTAELLRKTDKETALRNFLHAQNIIIVQCEEYHDEVQSFGNTYADVEEDNKVWSLVGSRTSIKEGCDFLHFIGLHVRAINSYTQSISNEEAIAIITRSQTDTTKLFASLIHKSSQTQKKLSQTFQNNQQGHIEHVIDKVLNYIHEAISLSTKENNPNTKKLIEKLAGLEDNLIRNKHSTNTEKNKETIQQALNILDQLEYIHIQNQYNDPIVTDSSIGSRDVELAYSKYTRSDIRHPEQKPHLTTYDKIIILTQFIRKDIIYNYPKTMTASYIMQTLNQAIYIAVLIYIVYGIVMILMGNEYIQNWTYNLVNIGVLGIARYTVYKIYQKYNKYIYLTIGAVILIWQIVSHFIYS